MRFYRCIEDHESIKIGDVICKSFFHWQIVIVSDSKNKTRFISYISKEDLSDSFKAISMVELNKLKPHLLKTIFVDYRISFNDDCYSKLSSQCCYDCGSKTFGTIPNITSHCKGTCSNCKKKDRDIYYTNMFETNIFKD